MVDGCFMLFLMEMRELFCFKLNKCVSACNTTAPCILHTHTTQLHTHTHVDNDDDAFSFFRFLYFLCESLIYEYDWFVEEESRLNKLVLANYFEVNNLSRLLL